MLKTSSRSTSSVRLDLYLCDPASSQQTTTEQHPVERKSPTHDALCLHRNCSQNSRDQLGKRFPFGKELD